MSPLSKESRDRRATARQARSEKPYYKWVVLGTVVFSLLIILLDVTVVNVAIPHILTDFKTDISNVQWVFNGYTLAFAASLITFGRLGDMYGHKKLFMIGLAAFGLSSIASGAAPTIEWLIAFRVLQGIAGAMMMPATLSLLLQAFPKHQRGLALGFWGAAAGIAITIGPLLGGFLTDNFSWRWVFYINIPVVIIALILTATFIHQKIEGLQKHKLDLGGLVTVTGGLLALTYGLIEGQKHGWGSALIVSLFVLAAVLLIAFAFIERRVKEPMVNLELFKDRNFAIGNLVALLISFALLGAFFLIPLFVQQVLGFSAFKSGLITLPMSLVMLFLAPNVGRLSDKYGGRWFIAIGLTIASLGLFLLSHVSPQTTASDFIIPFGVFGIGMACVMPVMVNVALDRVPADQYGSGSGVMNTSRQLGGVLGVAIVGVFFTAQLTGLVKPAIESNQALPAQVKAQVIDQFGKGEVELTPPDTSAQTAQIAALPEPQRAAAEAQAAQMTQEIRRTIDPAIADAINHTFRFAMLFTLIGAVVALGIRAPQTTAKKADPVPSAG